MNEGRVEALTEELTSVHSGFLNACDGFRYHIKKVGEYQGGKFNVHTITLKISSQFNITGYEWIENNYVLVAS